MGEANMAFKIQITATFVLTSFILHLKYRVSTGFLPR